jgi:hypothetical protein
MNFAAALGGDEIDVLVEHVAADDSMPRGVSAEIPVLVAVVTVVDSSNPSSCWGATTSMGGSIFIAGPSRGDSTSTIFIAGPSRGDASRDAVIAGLPRGDT